MGQRATVTAFTTGSSAVMAALALVRPGRRVPGGVMTVCGEGIALAATSSSTEIGVLKGETTRMPLIFLESALESPKGRIDRSSEQSNNKW